MRIKRKLNVVVERPAKNGASFNKIKSGARILDPDSVEGRAFAETYYAEVRTYSTDCKRIAKNIGKSKKDIEAIKQYLFFTDGFEPDCAIAHSWQRLMQGKDIKKHDYTLIEHELYEMDIKKKVPQLNHYEAHVLASQKYNYQKEVDEYYGNLKKNKEN